VGGCSVVCRNCRRDVEIMQEMNYIIIYALLILMMSFFFIVLPNKKRHKRVQEMHESIRAGDTVITIGGVIATVIELEEDTLILRLLEDKECYMRVLIYAIQQIKNNEEHLSIKE